MEVYTVATYHVVPVAGIDEKVGVCTIVDASLQEGIGHLRDTDGVIASMDNEQTTLQVACLLQQAAVLVTFGVGLRCIHIAYITS